MRLIRLLLGGAVCASLLISCKSHSPEKPTAVGHKKKDFYTGPKERDLLEMEKTMDPALGYVPIQRLGEALEATEEMKRNAPASRIEASLNWEERGPIFDTVGPSNGNSRAGFHYTSGRIRAVLLDTLNDPTGNTLFAGGVAGGLWKCTNLLSTIPNWVPVYDMMPNLAISSICQDPSNPQVMYLSTGEPSSNADAVLGMGVWKSTDGGNNWSFLPSTANMIRNFKVICDPAGNVYLATRVLTTPVEQPYGLLRSSDGGATWQNITPSNLTTPNHFCTDIELSSTGRLHASFGYSTGATGGVVNHRYTDDPANVSPGSWSSSTGIRSIASPPVANRLELACLGNVLYAVTTNGSNNIDSCYKSTNGGATWTRQNASAYTSNLTNTQGWYNISLGINPANTDQMIVAGLDAYRSTNSGSTITRLTFWVTSAPYVHADHHYIQWYTQGGENRILMGCDGGIFLSRNGGTSFADKNRNLGIKQFYSAAIHPDAGSPYLIGGTQDNGCHQIKYPGLSPSIEITGGDGCFSHINQLNPSIQFGSYTNNQYRRSTNGGATWSSINPSSSQGLFVNPWDYDDATNTMYMSNGVSATPNNQIRRWLNANTTTATTVFTLTGLVRNGANSNASAFKVSPYTADRVYIGGSTGRLLRLDNARTVTAADINANITDLTSPSFPGGFMNCINVGSSDQYLVAAFTNYGVNNVWYSNNGGTSWSAVDGNLPDMPVRWAMFHPQFNQRLIIATDAGIYYTNAVNGSNTIWTPDVNYPAVRTDMLKMRTSDYTIVAASHGRGLYTAQLQLAEGPEIDFITNSTTVTERTTSSNGCRGYTDYEIGLGISEGPDMDANVQINLTAGTAVRGVDFDFTTNGDFNSPSDMVVFPAGMTNSKTITVRVYDDAEVESTESFEMYFDITGGSNAIAGLVDTHTFTIGDNDMAPIPVAVTVDHSVGQTNSLVTATSPFASNRIKHRVQSLYTLAELNAAGITKAALIRSLKLNVITKNSTRPYTGLTISMANSTVGTLSAGFTADTYTTVYSGDYSTVQGWNTFSFSTPFAWDGVSNIVVQVCFDNSAGPVDTYPDFVEGSTYPLGAGVRASTYSNYTTGATAGCALPAAFVSDNRYNAVFGVDFGTNPIATALNTNKTEYLNSYNDLYYYSSTGQIIARVRNLSGHNYGCTKVNIDRAGTGATRFWNNNKKNYLADKTYQVIPDMDHADGVYEITLYYTNAEKMGWEAATGNSWNDIQMVKVSGRIANVTPQNAQPNNNGTVEAVVNTIKGTYGGGHTLTAVITGKFGGIGVGMPGRQFNNGTMGRSDNPFVTAPVNQKLIVTNPFNTSLSLRFTNPVNSSVLVTLYDVSGRVVLKSSSSAQQFINLNSGISALKPGVYFLEVFADNKQYRVKLMKD